MVDEFYKTFKVRDYMNGEEINMECSWQTN